MEFYPQVIDENTTLDLVLAGQSITRFGDGEFRLAMGGKKNISQVNHPKLQQELQDILITRQRHCLVGIPDMNPESPKWWFWSKYLYKYPKMLDHKITYYSQFITRPDSAPLIDIPEFYDRMEKLWRDQEIILVRGSTRSLVEDVGPMQLAKKVYVVLCARRDAYAEIDNLERQILVLAKQHHCRRVLLCAGAMATVLTYRLSRHNLHAIDLGHIGMHWRMYASKKGYFTAPYKGTP